MRAYLINRQIDDIRGTLFRQTMFAEFGKRSMQSKKAARALRSRFKRNITRCCESYFAENFVLDPELDLECLRFALYSGSTLQIRDWNFRRGWGALRESVA